MFLTEEQASRRLNNESNLANLTARLESLEKPQESEVFIPEVIEETIHRPGRKSDVKSLSQDESNEIAIRARLGERQETLAEEFNITQPNVSYLKNGKTKKVNEEVVDKVVSEVRDKALERLMKSLNLITDDKLSGCSARDLSVIASNMGRVVEKTMPKSESSDTVNFIVYAPELRQEKSFPSVEI